ncbi:hypothetical protein ACFVL4_15275 [Bacillus subtilis]|uniref:hypothetical protein n=1 Tax=Bacillus subtilis TaxID=1423 RepID=UPI0022F3E011|nr:hypothetical protein [Bacillus subtilis]WBY39804.1 hypothetical protein PF977_10855 [Bacillus subtilis]
MSKEICLNEQKAYEFITWYLNKDGFSVIKEDFNDCSYFYDYNQTKQLILHKKDGGQYAIPTELFDKWNEERGVKMTEEEMYVEQFKAWREEMDLSLKQIEDYIETCKKKIELNIKQRQLQVERVNIGVEEFNKWAETSNVEARMEPLVIDVEKYECEGVYHYNLYADDKLFKKGVNK